MNIQMEKKNVLHVTCVANLFIYIHFLNSGTSIQWVHE